MIVCTRNVGSAAADFNHGVRKKAGRFRTRCGSGSGRAQVSECSAQISTRRFRSPPRGTLLHLCLLGRLQFNPGRRMVAGLFPAPHLAGHAAPNQRGAQGGAEQDVVDAQARVARERVAEILPEGIDARSRQRSSTGRRPLMPFTL